MSADKGGPRDWDKELAEIDKLIEAGPKAPAPAQLPAKAGAKRQTAAPAAAPRESTGGGRLAAMRFSTTMTWVRLGLALLVGVAMTQ